MKWLIYGRILKGLMVSIGVVLIILVVLFSSQLPFGTSWLFLIPAVIYLCCAILFGRNRRAAHNAIAAMLEYDCDAVKYTQIVKAIVDSTCAEKKTRMLYRMMYINGLLMLGEFKKVHDMLQLKRPIYTKRYLRPLEDFQYVNYWTAYYIHVNNAKAARESYINEQSKLKDIFNIPKLEKYGKRYQENVSKQMYGIFYTEGEYDKCKQYYQETFDTVHETELKKVFAAYRLAVIHKNQGELGKSKEYFRYVIKHGNNLYIVDQAKKAL